MILGFQQFYNEEYIPLKNTVNSLQTTINNMQTVITALVNRLSTL